MPQQDDTTIELFSQSRQISDLQAELAARDAEIKRLREQVNALIEEKDRLNMVIELNNAMFRDAF